MSILIDRKKNGTTFKKNIVNVLELFFFIKSSVQYTLTVNASVFIYEKNTTGNKYFCSYSYCYSINGLKTHLVA